MEKALAAIGLSLIMILAIPILGSFFGALSGWAVSLVWNDAILGFLSRIGVDTNGLTLWQVGASMGFLGGFLKTSVHKRGETK